jgi:hypothetical protein
LQGAGYYHQEIITPELYCGFTKTPPMTDLNHRVHTTELAGSDERSVQAFNLL